MNITYQTTWTCNFQLNVKKSKSHEKTNTKSVADYPMFCFNHSIRRKFYFDMAKLNKKFNGLFLFSFDEFVCIII